jgi:hypothetical protein
MVFVTRLPFVRGAGTGPKIVSLLSPLGKRDIKNKILFDINCSVVKRNGI